MILFLHQVDGPAATLGTPGASLITYESPKAAKGSGADRTKGVPDLRTGRMAMIQNILFPVDFSPTCVAMAPLVTEVRVNHLRQGNPPSRP